MAINEEKERIVTGKKLRRFVGGEYPWERISFWHKASDCEMDNGVTTVEDEINLIKKNIANLDTKNEEINDVLKNGTTGHILVSNGNNFPTWTEFKNPMMHVGKFNFSTYFDETATYQIPLDRKEGVPSSTTLGWGIADIFLYVINSFSDSMSAKNDCIEIGIIHKKINNQEGYNIATSIIKSGTEKASFIKTNYYFNYINLKVSANSSVYGNIYRISSAT